jgi:S1-C subfamily serine protease
MIVDIIICILFLGVLLRGRDIGFIRQIFSTVGFFGGLFLGASFIEPHIIQYAHTPLSRALLTLVSTLGVSLVTLAIGDYVGGVLKSHLQTHKINTIDVVLGAAAGGMTLLITVWLIAPVLAALPFPELQTAIRNSIIIEDLNANLPSAPNAIADLNHLIDPNGFPKVFSGAEPTIPSDTKLPNLGSLQPAVTADEASVVKIEGKGCGGIVEGSGFVVAKGVVVTNAHVVAGISNPYIMDGNGTHKATVIWFNPNLDLAVLTASNLAGKPLNVQNGAVANGTAGAVLGYPGGGPFNVQPATIVEEFSAAGKNIYNQGNTTRNVYEIKATVIPGNSGGPLINKQGTVVGVVFAESTTYNQVGYALVTKAVVNQMHQAENRNTPTSTGSCAE